MGGKQESLAEMLPPELSEELHAMLAKIIIFEKNSRGFRADPKAKRIPPYVTAPITEPKAQKMHSKRKLEGLAALKYIVGLKIPLIGAYETGAMIAKKEIWDEAFTTDIDVIKALRAGTYGMAKGKRIQRFYFLPKNVGLLCLDIDNKNGKDGIREFYLFCEKAGKPRHLLPSYLQDIPQSLPCYVSTPSGGFHLYFSYLGRSKLQKKPLSSEALGVEVVHGSPGLTSPGSYKNGKPYILHGDIKTAPLFPPFILDAIEKPEQKSLGYISHGIDREKGNKPSWEKIRKWAEKSGSGAGRNDRAFYLACCARNHRYTEAETVSILLQGEPGLEGLPEREIESTVKSAFSRKETA